MNASYAPTARKSIEWPEPFEKVYQAQRRARPSLSGRGYRPDIGRPLRLLIASAVDLGEARPHGMITWLAGVLETSRQTIYDIGESWTGATRDAEESAELEEGPGDQRNRIASAALTLLVVGAMRLRGVEICLDRRLGYRRSLGWLCRKMSGSSWTRRDRLPATPSGSPCGTWRAPKRRQVAAGASW
jgi:hypothetical protein